MVSEVDPGIVQDIYSIYVTPQHAGLEDEFEQANLPESSKTHIFWNHSENENSIVSFLKIMLNAEAKGNIEPLNEYTLHTIKAFIQFIESDFRSEKQEEKDRRNDGQYTLEFEELNQESNIEEKLLQLKNQLERSNPSLQGRLSGPDLNDKRFPQLQLTHSGIKIVINAGYKSRDKASFSYTIDRETADSKERLRALADKLGVDLKKPNDKYGSYCRTQQMQQTIKLTNIQKLSGIL